MDSKAFSDWPRLDLRGQDGGPPEVYVLELFATSKALEWQQRLAGLGLEPLAMLLSERDLPWATIEEADFAVVSRTLLAKLEQEKLPRFLQQLLSGVYVLRQAEHGTVPQPLANDFDLRFRGRTLDVYRLAGWVLAENFRDFFAAVHSIGAALRSRFNVGSPSDRGTAQTQTPSTQQPETSSPPNPPM